MRWIIVSAALVSGAAFASDNDGYADRTVTTLHGSDTLSPDDTTNGRIENQDVVDLSRYAEVDKAAQQLDAYAKKVTLLVGRHIQDEKAGKIRVHIDEEGRLDFGVVVQHSGDRTFDKAMVKAAKKTKRVPAPPELVSDKVADGLVLEFSPSPY